MSDVELNLSLSLSEAVAITNLIGSLPTSQGAWPLFEKLKSQVEPHLPKPEQKEA